MFKVENIETERLLLRQFKMTDFDDFVEYRDDPNLFTYLMSERKTMEEYKTSFEETVKSYDSENSPQDFWAIELKEENKVVGYISVNHKNPVHKFCEMAWLLNAKYHKRGIVTEAAKAVIDFIFKNSDFHRISVLIWKENELSRKLAERLGFVQEGVLRQARRKNERFYDVFEYGLLIDEWKNKK